MTDLQTLRSLMKVPDAAVSIDRDGVADTSRLLLELDDAAFQELMVGVDVSKLPQWCKNTLQLRARQPKAAP